MPLNTEIKILFTHKEVILEFSGVDAVWIDNASVTFHHSDTAGASTVQITHGVHAHITKALQKKNEKGENSYVCITFFCHVINNHS